MSGSKWSDLGTPVSCLLFKRLPPPPTQKIVAAPECAPAAGGAAAADQQPDVAAEWAGGWREGGPARHPPLGVHPRGGVPGACSPALDSSSHQNISLKA